MPLSLAKIQEVAPDQASLDAARKLLKSAWPLLSGDGELIWGECQGSGSQPYRVMLSEIDLGYKCTCPSRKLPCKHVLALMWLRVDGRSFGSADRPGWVLDWVARRRSPAAAKPAAKAAEPKDIALAATAEPDDPKAGARAQAQRERNQAEREAAILAGLDDLDRWLTDQLERGLAAFPAVAAEQCRTLSRRLVDAKAPSLAARVERLPAMLFAMPEPERVEFLVEKLGELHLMAEAYRRQAELSDALRADIRAAIGWPVTREGLLADPQALRLRGRWMVLAALTEVQPDKLRRVETWLARLSAGEGPHFALLMDFVPVSVSTVKNTWLPGEAFEAELVFYPSGAVLRAIIGEQSTGAAPCGRWQPAGDDVAAALDGYDAALAARPWLGDWPLALKAAMVTRQSDSFALMSPEGSGVLPMKVDDPDPILPLLGLEPIDAFGLWDGRQLALKFAETPLGRWLA
jgi:uncharacterized Zn finger protein